MCVRGNNYKWIATSSCNKVQTQVRVIFEIKQTEGVQTASVAPLLTVCSVSLFHPCVPPPPPTSLTHSTHLEKGFPSEANSNMHLPSDPWPWADKVTSHDFYSRFWLHTSLCVSPAWNSTSDTVVMKSPELRGSGQTCCSDALQARADKNIKTMTAKYERWTKPQRMIEREGSKRWRSTRIYTLNKSVM